MAETMTETLPRRRSKTMRRFWRSPRTIFGVVVLGIIVLAAIFVVAAVISMWGLAVAMETIPTGTAYAVWTATGASLTVLWAMLRGTEPATLVRVLLLLGIVSCVVGLKAVA